ncbi:hypothetical protein AKO1_008710, partial [Acrasis kona]
IAFLYTSVVSYLYPSTSATGPPSPPPSQQVKHCVLPWQNVKPSWRGNEDTLKQYILKLPTLDNIFWVQVPEQHKEELDYDLAKELLKIDENLSDARFELVPKSMSEDNFWEVYFYLLHVVQNANSTQELDDTLLKLTQDKKIQEELFLVEFEQEYKKTTSIVTDGLELCRTFIHQALLRRDHKIDPDNVFLDDTKESVSAVSVEKSVRECIELKKKISILATAVHGQAFDKIEGHIHELGNLFTTMMTQYEKFKELHNDELNVLKCVSFCPTLLDNKNDSFTTPIQRQKICATVLPQRYRIRNWRLLYSTAQHGVSIHSFYRLVADHSSTLLIIQTDRGRIFGCYAAGFQINPKYYGSGEQVVFTFCSPEEDKKNFFEYYVWSKKNDYFVRSTLQNIAIGGGTDGKAALFLDGELRYGSTNSCMTFLNQPLNGMDEDFNIHALEVWTFEEQVSKNNFKPIRKQVVESE